VVNPTLGKAIMDVFPVRERGIAMGVKQMGLTIGGVISALALPAIAAALGWRYAMGTCALVVALPVALGWYPLGAFRAGSRAVSPDRLASTGSSWWWARRPALVIFFATGFVLGMVQAAVLSYLPLFTVQALGFDKIGAGLLVAASQAGGAVSRLALGAASDRWLTERRSLWITGTGAVGAAIFGLYAVWPATAPLTAGLLAFATGVGAYGWVGIFFVISAEAGGPREAVLLSCGLRRNRARAAGGAAGLRPAPGGRQLLHRGLGRVRRALGAGGRRRPRRGARHRPRIPSPLRMAARGEPRYHAASAAATAPTTAKERATWATSRSSTRCGTASPPSP
jgi:MFS family permease